MQAKVFLGARILLGLIFTVFGANGLMMSITGKGFIPMPALTPEQMKMFTAFAALSYLMPLVKVLELIGGLMLLSGRFVNLAIVLLAPIVVNILCVHLFLDRSGIVMALVVTILLAILIKGRWQAFRPLLDQ